eukprot:UN15979
MRIWRSSAGTFRRRTGYCEKSTRGVAPVLFIRGFVSHNGAFKTPLLINMCEVWDDFHVKIRPM